MKNDLKEQRHQIRFHADDNTFIIVKFSDKEPLGGICINESYNGCSGVFSIHDFFIKGAKCLIRVGKLDTLNAEIAWVKQLDDDIIKVGFHYLD